MATFKLAAMRQTSKVGQLCGVYLSQSFYPQAWPGQILQEYKYIAEPCLFCYLAGEPRVQGGNPI